MNRATKIAIFGIFILVPLLIWLKKTQVPPRVESDQAVKSPTVLGAQGRVEGRTETISLGASADGVVKQVLVTDGQNVSKGDLLAVINCDDISAEIELAAAQAESARQARIRLLRGHRDEERKAAAQETDAAQAVLTQAQEHFRRIDGLYEKGEVSRDAFEQTKRDLDVAQADYEKALDEQSLADAQPLPEEISRADAEVAAAERNVNVEKDKLEKCNVRAPISGTVLKVMTKIGESYSTLLPHPLFSIADESVRRVRAEVDERDIGKIRLGQESIITADGFPGQKFEGQVIQISPAMKAKSVLSDDPAQKEDRDVLDVIVELKDPKADLPLGLRVTAQMTDETKPIPEPSAERPENLWNLKADAKAETTSVSAVTAVAPAQPSGFVLQVGAMTHRENATALSEMLRKQSFPAFVSAKDGDPFYRVDVGPYPSSSQAKAAKGELKEAGFATVIERKYLAAAR